jgi:hypothetical protein
MLLLLLVFCHAGASKGCKCAGLVDVIGDSADGEAPADAAMLTGGGGMA